MNQIFGCSSQVLVQSQSMRVMKKTAKVGASFLFVVGSMFIFVSKLKLDLHLILPQVLFVMPKNLKSSQKGKRMCIIYTQNCGLV